MTIRSPSSTGTLRHFILPALALCFAVGLTVAACAGLFKNAPVVSAGVSASRNGGADAGACASCLLSSSCGSKGCDEAVEITAGDNHTCARRASGQVVCWGANGSGDLGDGTTTDPVTPVAVKGLTDAVEVTAGFLHTCARRISGQVVCWGSNQYGELGDGTNPYRVTPTNISPL